MFFVHEYTLYIQWNLECSKKKLTFEHSFSKKKFGRVVKTLLYMNTYYLCNEI